MAGIISLLIVARAYALEQDVSPEGADQHQIQRDVIGERIARDIGDMLSQPSPTRAPSRDSRQPLVDLVSQLIEHAPWHPLLSNVVLYSYDPGSPSHAQLRRSWEEAIPKYRNNPIVLSNAARFYARSDRAKSLSLLSECVSLDGGNPIWAMQIATMYLDEIPRDKIAFADRSPESHAEFIEEYGERARFVLSTLAPSKLDLLDLSDYDRWRLGARSGNVAIAMRDTDYISRLADYMTEVHDRNEDGLTAISKRVVLSSLITSNDAKSVVAINRGDRMAAVQHFKESCDLIVDAGKGDRALPSLVIPYELLMNGDVDSFRECARHVESGWPRLKALLDNMLADAEAGRPILLGRSLSLFD